MYIETVSTAPLRTNYFISTASIEAAVRTGLSSLDYNISVPSVKLWI